MLETLPEAGLTIVGGGFDYDDNVALVGRLGLGTPVRMVDFVPNATPYMAAADVLVLPSRREGLPITALEGLALGRPFVATRVGGTPTVVRDPQTGWLVEPADEAGLAAALIAAGSDLAEAARRGARGRALVEREWPIARLYDRVEQILTELTGAAPLRLKPAPYYAAKHVVQRTRAARASSRETRWSGLRVLAYHRVSADRDELAVHPESFRRHVQALCDARYETVSLDTGLDRLDAGETDVRMVAVTFDDGYLDVAEHALPVLAELGIPATIYVATAVTAGNARFAWYRHQPPLITGEELALLAAGDLVEVGAHTRTHPSLPQLDDAAARGEIAGSRQELELVLGRPVTTFAYPAGRFSPRDVEIVRAAGFRAAVTCEPGVNGVATDRAVLHRTLVDRRDRDDDFLGKLDGRLDHEWALRTYLHARRSARPHTTRSQTT